MYYPNTLNLLQTGFLFELFNLLLPQQVNVYTVLTLMLFKFKREKNNIIIIGVLLNECYITCVLITDLFQEEAFESMNLQRNKIDSGLSKLEGIPQLPGKSYLNLINLFVYSLYFKVLFEDVTGRSCVLDPPTCSICLELIPEPEEEVV